MHVSLSVLATSTGQICCGENKSTSPVCDEIVFKPVRGSMLCVANPAPVFQDLFFSYLVVIGMKPFRRWRPVALRAGSLAVIQYSGAHPVPATTWYWCIFREEKKQRHAFVRIHLSFV